MKYSIVLPVYNESGSLKELHESLTKVMRSLHEKYEIIFINDGSTDNSLEVLKKLKQKDGKIIIINFRRNFGQSAAMKAGFDHAKGKIIIAMDADLQNDARDIPRMIKKIKEGYDVVTGWRKRRHDPLSKKIPSKFSNWLHRKITGINMHDSGCSLKAYRKECLDGIELYGEMHRYIPAMIAQKGYKITEIPVIHHQRKHGQSKYGVTRLLKGSLDLLDLAFWTRYAARPLHVFGGLGMLFSGVGAALGIILGVLRIMGKISLRDSVLPLLAALLFIIGIQFLVFGILADIMIKMYYSDKKHKTYEIEEMIR